MSALTDSTNTNTVIEDIEKVSSPQKMETIITEKASPAAAKSTTTVEEETSENVPVEATVTAGENAEVKETVVTEITSMEATSEASKDEEVAVVAVTEVATEPTTELTTPASEVAEVADKMKGASSTNTGDTPVSDNIDKVEAAPEEKTEKGPVEKMDTPAENTEKSPITDASEKNKESVENAEEAKSATETAEMNEAEETPMEQEESLTELSPEEIKKKISENLIAGRRFMKTDSFPQAVEVLGVCAALAAELHGEAHEETFEVNFLYGKSLLEVARVEDGVLTNALTDIPKSVDGEENVQDDVVENPENVSQKDRADIKKSVEEALGVAAEEPETIHEVSMIEEQEEKEANEKAETAEEEKTDADADTTARVVEDVEMEGVEEETAAEEQEANQTDSEDDDDTIKLAWELLETSRCICERKIKDLESMGTVDTEAVKTWKLNQADVLTSLGEHGMIDSKYEQAQKDLLEAVAIQTAHLPATSRIIANTTHLLAKAFSMDTLFEEAATQFNNSKNILIAKLEELKNQLESASEEEKVEIQLDIKELEEVIPELESFVVDARASAEQTKQVKAAAKQELDNAAAEIAKISGEEVNDITSMVRRPTKRPASEESAEEVKKRKSEDGTETIPDEKAASAPSEESESASAPVTKE